MYTPSYTYKNLGSISSLGSMPRYEQDPYALRPFVPQNNPYKINDNYAARLEQAGQEVPDRQSGSLTNGLMTVLNVMQRPQSMVTNILSDLTDDKKDSVGDVLKGAWQGLTGERKSSTVDVIGNVGDRLGVDLRTEKNPDGKWYNPLTWSLKNTLINTVGFVGDVALDPTTYLSGGATAITKMGAKAGQVGVKELGEHAAKHVLGSTDEVVERISKSLLREPDAIKSALAKHGENSDIVMRISAALAEAGSNRAGHILDKGLDHINKDVIDDFTTRLRASLDDLKRGDLEPRTVDKSFGRGKNKYTQTVTEPPLANALARSIGSVLGKDIGDLGWNQATKKLWDNAGNGVSEGFTNAVAVGTKLDELFNAGVGAKRGVSRVAEEAKPAIIRNVYGMDVAPDVLAKFSGTELDVLDTLYNGFNMDLGDAMLLAESTANKLGTISDAAIGRGKGLLAERMATFGKAAKIENGIEFANGLQRVYDASQGRFFLRYHNPFTGTIKPILELTNVIKAEPMRKAFDAVISANPFGLISSPVGKAVQKGAYGVANAFGTVFNKEHVDLAMKQASPELYESMQLVAKTVTKYQREEMALPKRALEAATGLFRSNKEFLQNDKLHRALTYYVERNNDAHAMAAWHIIRGEADSTLLDDKVSAALSDIQANAGMYNYLKKLALQAGEEAEIEKLGAKVKMFNESILDYDIRRGVNFENVPENMINNANTSGYVRHVVGKESLDDKLRKLRDLDPTHAAAMKTSDFMGSAQERTFTSVALRKLSTGEDMVDDIFTTMAIRSHESMQVQLNKEFLRFMEGATKDPVLGRLIQPINASKEVTQSAYKDFQGKFKIHPELEPQFQRIQSLYTPGGHHDLLKFYDDITNTLKRFQTSLNPSFIFKNFIGEPLMNFIGDVSIESHSRAMDIMRDAKASGLIRIGDTVFMDEAPVYRQLKNNQYQLPQEGSFKGGVTVTDKSGTLAKSLETEAGAKHFNIGGVEYTARQLYEEFNRQGLGWSGVSKGNLVQDTQTLISREVAAEGAKGLKKIGAVAAEAGDFVETWTRLSMFIDRLEKGFDFKTAADEVRKFHVDYRDLSTVESSFLRRVMPYYTYMRHNLPIQIRSLLSSHGKVGMIGHLVDNSYEAINRQFEGGIAVDDYLREGMAIPIDVDGEGNVQYLNWGMPLADLARIQYTLRDFVDKNVLDMTHPLIRAMFEIGTNQSMSFSGKDIEEYPGQTTPLIPGFEGGEGLQISRYADYAIQQTGIIEGMRKALGQGLAQVTGQEEDPLKPRNPMAYVGLSSALPVRNQYQTANNQAFELRDQLQARVKQLEEQGIYVPTVDEVHPYYKRKNIKRFVP